METTSKYELDFLDAFHQCEEEDFPSRSWRRPSPKLSELAAWAKVMEEEHDAQEVEALLEQFALIAGDAASTADELDNTLEMLYDWADGWRFRRTGPA
jgi:hypothetical protein